ncbi:DUF6789 family protein [Mucilaginibacter aquatilis]|uniref:DUF1440 domain-containing protein n=1 Tax=Mucilaginibacter aquatilis TaxID=1517760 RepID=A0A6I4IQS0_9SPHI|nr:DUF6789 family protein [Mucilaginibacter aquatilis]MVN91624.1 hypothetical protein [Mucilaginibacter aquatilis]
MNIKDILMAGFTGTTVMTLFSETVSQLKNANYNEAEILAKLIKRASKMNKRQSTIAGWAAHYAVGTLFAVTYKALLDKGNIKPDLLNGALFGGISGLGGAAIWHSTFNAHPNPPGVNLKNYYTQLVIAHVIFGMAAALVFRVNNQKSKSNDEDAR